MDRPGSSCDIVFAVLVHCYTCNNILKITLFKKLSPPINYSLKIKNN